MEIICARCHTPQRPTAKFCRLCGLKLERTITAGAPATERLAQSARTALLSEPPLEPVPANQLPVAVSEPLSPSIALTEAEASIELADETEPKEGVITLPWIETGAEARPLELASFAARLEAAVVNVFVSLLVAFATIVIVAAIADAPTLAMLLFFALLALCLVFLANDLILTSVWGQSIGMMVTGIRLVKKNGDEIGFLGSLFRHSVGYLISVLVLGLGFLWILFDAERQGWHDKLSQTYVVRIDENDEIDR